MAGYYEPSAMDIMRPKLTRIGNMCFRRLDIPNDGIIDDFSDGFEEELPTLKELPNNDSKDTKEDNVWEEDSNKIKSIDCLEEIDCSEEVAINDISNGKGSRFRACLEIGKFFHGSIIGYKGNQKREIEYNSRCRILVPTQTDLTGAIVITGDRQSDVKQAINDIKNVVRRARNLSDFTHFLSIPFNEAAIRDRFLTFKNQILSDNEINRGIDESLFQNSSKIHLTVVPLLLTDNKEKDKSSKILGKCELFIKELTKGQPISVKLEGIDYMNDDPTQVKVLFAKVVDISDNHCLQIIVEYLYSQFEESGLISRHSLIRQLGTESKVKIHVTLMNTSFKNKGDWNKSRVKGRQQNNTYFNASGILDKHKDFFFGQIDIKTIELSIRHSYKGKDGYYSHIARIDL